MKPLIRRGAPADAEACHRVMWASIIDLGVRHGTPLNGSADDWWTATESLQQFLGDHAAEWWVAEDQTDGALVGYGRSIERGGLLELAEFFVGPAHQSAGVGRALLDRAFPLGRGDIRSIIATTDVRALSRYYSAGTAARFPMWALGGVPTSTSASELVADPIDPASDADLRDVAALDVSVLEYQRQESEIRWLMEGREGFLYRRNGKAIGFAFVGAAGVGPAAVFDAVDLPAVLLHIEARAVATDIKWLEFQVPAPNEVATRHLLSRGFRLDPWVNLLMSNRSFGHFDRLLTFGPPVFL